MIIHRKESQPDGYQGRGAGPDTGQDFRKVGSRWISRSFPFLPADSWQPMKERRACFPSEGREVASLPEGEPDRYQGGKVQDLFSFPVSGG